MQGPGWDGLVLLRLDRRGTGSSSCVTRNSTAATASTSRPDRDQGRRPRHRKTLGSSTRGRLDYLPNELRWARGSCSAPAGAKIARRYGPRHAAGQRKPSALLPHTQPMFDMVVLNTRRPPLRSRAAGTAVEYAGKWQAMRTLSGHAPALGAGSSAQSATARGPFTRSRAPNLRAARRSAGRSGDDRCDVLDDRRRFSAPLQRL